MIKSFHIAFADVFYNDGDQLGTISRAKSLTTFSSSFTAFTRDQYEKSWIKTVKDAVLKRQSSALITSVDADENGDGTVHCFPLIPSENAIKNEAVHLNDDEDSPDGIYISDITILFMCLNPERLRIPRYIDHGDGTFGDEESVVFFDTERPECIVPHIGNHIDEYWWYISNEDMLEALENDLKP